MLVGVLVFINDGGPLRQFRPYDPGARFSNPQSFRNMTSYNWRIPGRTHGNAGDLRELREAAPQRQQQPGVGGGGAPCTARRSGAEEAGANGGGGAPGTSRRSGAEEAGAHDAAGQPPAAAGEQPVPPSSTKPPPLHTPPVARTSSPSIMSIYYQRIPGEDPSVERSAHHVLKDGGDGFGALPRKNVFFNCDGRAERVSHARSASSQVGPGDEPLRKSFCTGTLFSTVFLKEVVACTVLFQPMGDQIFP